MVASTAGMAEYAATAITLSDTAPVSQTPSTHSLPSMSKSLLGTSKTGTFCFIPNKIGFVSHGLLD